MSCEVKQHVKIQRFGEGIPVVFIHGLGSRKEAWIPQHELANKYRLVIPDLRGHGETEMNEGITLKNFALDVIELLEHLDIPQHLYVGYRWEELLLRNYTNNVQI